MGKQLFIVKAGAAPADALAISSIVAGKAGFAVEGTSAVKAAIEAGDRVQLIAKRADGSPEVSAVFSPGDVVKKSVIAPSAGTAQVSQITLDIPAGQAKNDEWIVKVIETTPGTRAAKTYNFSVFHKGTDFTANTLTDAFVAKINAAGIGITASNAADVLVLTADNTVTTFRLAVDAMAELSVIEYTTSNVPAAGTPEVIAALEKELQSFGRGITNQTEYPVKKPDSQVESGATYTLYVFDMLIKTPDYSGVASQRTATYKLYIAEADALAANHVGKVLSDLV